MHGPRFDAQTHDAGGTVKNRSALDVFMGREAVRGTWLLRALLLVGAIFVATGVWSAAVAQSTPAGTRIENAARIAYRNMSGEEASVATNTVVATVSPLPSSSRLEILRVGASTPDVQASAGPTLCVSTEEAIALPAPTLANGTSIDPLQPLSLVRTPTLHGGEALFVHLADSDQNLDATVIDHADVHLASPSGDRESLRLAETGPATGTFVGYIQTQARTAIAANCVLEVDRNAEVSTHYVDRYDSTDTSQAVVMVDPYGLIFDSATGAPINGARVRLIDASSNALASVYGDDGVSTYPAEMVTGSAVTDSSGTVYTLPAGVFRFPLVAEGQYRLEVDPPAGHAFPSRASSADLARTPGAPFKIQTGSFGEEFAVAGPVPTALDVPVDAAPTQLFVQKSTTTNVASVGDFVQYTVVVENVSTSAAVHRVRTEDYLPLGARYMRGSTRIAGTAASDPAISEDGRTLRFEIDALAAGQRVELRYVVEVTAGARGKQLVNSARAFGPDGLASNTAQATIQLREELFRDRAIVLGRIVEGDCSRRTQDLKGVAGVRVYLEDGRYSITDEEGRYHFDDVAPGSHVVQLDTVTIPESHRPLLCADRVRNAGRAYSQFVDVRGGALWRSDFVLERAPIPQGTLSLMLETELAGPSTLRHRAAVSARDLGVSNAKLMLVLPDGLSLIAARSRFDQGGRAEARIDGNVAMLTLGDIDAASEKRIEFETQVDGTSASGALALKAVAFFDTPAASAQKTAPVENVVLRGQMTFESAFYRLSLFNGSDSALDAADRAQLDRIVEEWSGVSHLRLAAAAHDEGDALSSARAHAIASYLVTQLEIDPARVNVEVRGLTQTAQAPTVHKGIEISIEGFRTLAAGGFTVRSGSAHSTPVTTHGVLTSKVAAASARQKSAARSSAPATLIEVDALQPGVKWLTPAADENPTIPSIKVAIQHLPTQRIELLANGSPVSPLNFDGSTTNDAKTVSLSRWRGVELRDGSNSLVAIVRDADDRELERLTRTIRYSGGAVRAELARESSVLIADGRARPTIALRMFDAAGEPARPGTQGAYSVDAPYRSWWEVDSLNDNKLVATEAREPTFRVDSDGIARLELEPTTQAGTAVVRLRFNERQQQEMRVWLEPAARDWILVGIAEGTAAHKYISDNMQSARDAGLEDGYSEGGRLAFFAKGSIKGEYLLTAAYDSAREHALEKDRLLGAVEPDRFYTLYGDATEQRFEAATARKLFLKLERRQFAALFGDFETGMTVTELSRYSRTFTGFKSDYAGERFGFTAFAAESDQGYVKDELQGDGTSGLYRLSRRPLIINTDKIRIEVRDRIRSEVIVETRQLTRHIDYSIDYLNGTLFFKQPVPSRDASFNPVFIIAEYEVLSGGEAEMTAGGRASLKFANDKLELGGSFLREGATVGDSAIAGTDLRWQIGAATEFRAELARSDSDDPARSDGASAYLTELKHVGEQLDARVYVREQESGFGLGQQLTLDTGTRKAGVDGRYRFTERVAVEAETFRQEVLDTGATRELASGEVRYEADDYTAGLGARHVADAGPQRGETQSQQAFINGSVDLFGDLFTLRASQDLALRGKNGSVDFPNRSIVGLDYHWRPETSFFAEYEHADGERFDADMTRVGVRSAPWHRAQLRSSLNQQASEYGPRVFANVGLTQGWQLSDRWSFDVGVDQSKTVSGADVEPLDPDVPLSSGTMNGDFLATFIGALYRTELWTFTTRIEHRDSDTEDRWVVSGGFYREPSAGHAFSLATQWFDSAFANGSDAAAADVQLAWAYRPVSSAWIILNRLDLKHEARSDALGEFESARLIDNLNASVQLDARTQLGIQLGARYVRSTIDGSRYSGLSTLYGLDMRRDLTHRFDVGIHGTMLSSLKSNVSDRSIGIDLGISVAQNMWVSVGYNFNGFEDDDFQASRYTAQGPFIKFRVKADQDTFKDIVGVGHRAR